MKLHLFIPFLVFVYSLANAQVAERVSAKHSSPHERFTVVVEGLFYEGYLGQQNLIYKNHAGKTLWTGISLLPCPPVISEIGDLAIMSWNSVLFVDSTGKEIALYQPKQLESFWPYEGDMAWPLHRFSPESHYYFMFLKVRPDSTWIVGHDDSVYVQLVSLTRTGQERWRFNIPNELRHISTSITLSRGRVLVHNFNMATARDIRNLCYLLTDQGEVLAKYSTKLRRPCPPKLENGTFALCEGDSLNIYSLRDGAFLRTIPK